MAARGILKMSAAYAAQMHRIGRRASLHMSVRSRTWENIRCPSRQEQSRSDAHRPLCRLPASLSRDLICMVFPQLPPQNGFLQFNVFIDIQRRCGDSGLSPHKARWSKLL